MEYTLATYYAGTSGDMTFDSVPLSVMSWKFTDSQEIIETTTVSSGGFKTIGNGKRNGSGEAEALFDDDIDYGTPPCLKTGSSGTFTLEVVSGGASVRGSCVITSVDYAHDLDGMFKYSLKFETTGSYLIPGET